MKDPNGIKFNLKGKKNVVPTVKEVKKSFYNWLDLKSEDPEYSFCKGEGIMGEYLNHDPDGLELVKYGFVTEDLISWIWVLLPVLYKWCEKNKRTDLLVGAILLPFSEN